MRLEPAIRTPHVKIGIRTQQLKKDGPDIGFVRLSSHSVNQIASVFSFVNLENHQIRLGAEDIPIDHGVWVEMGYPEELGDRSRDAEQRITTTQVYCLASHGTVDRISHRDGFDYYDSIVFMSWNHL